MRFKVSNAAKCIYVGSGLDAVIRPIFSNGSFDALSCRSCPEIGSFGPERLLSPKADSDEKPVYLCYADNMA